MTHKVVGSDQFPNKAAKVERERREELYCTFALPDCLPAVAIHPIKDHSEGTLKIADY